jgi:hypothetical protein
MKAFSKLNQSKVMLMAALACMIFAGSMAAFAVPPGQVARSLTGLSITAQCCVPIGPTVKVTEPTSVAPVIVTFSSDYSMTGESIFSLSVNGGPCLAFGPIVAPFLSHQGGNAFYTSTYQWAVLPGDGVLVPGANTFTVCAGGNAVPQTINLGFRTLSVQIGK